ncbi:MAG: hypothetical protein CMO80_06295 [Verrucomicrobiales bacterium]|nr:hypothetical protein [Verrucomicrobiales bacterium]
METLLSLWNGGMTSRSFEADPVASSRGGSYFRCSGRRRCGSEIFTAQRTSLKVIFMGGYSNQLIEHGDELQHGVNFISKPFKTEDLAKFIRQRLDLNGSV